MLICVFQELDDFVSGKKGEWFGRWSKGGRGLWRLGCEVLKGFTGDGTEQSNSGFRYC